MISRYLESYHAPYTYGFTSACLLCRAAVHFEMGHYEEAIKDCDAAIERGRELRADYKLVAKAFTRKANALVRLDQLEEAIQIYHKALTEHRYPSHLMVIA